MSRYYVTARAFKGDWHNHSHGRVMKCPTCGHQFTAYVPIKDAWCPRGHVMKVLTGRPTATSYGHGNCPKSGPDSVTSGLPDSRGHLALTARANPLKSEVSV